MGHRHRPHATRPHVTRSIDESFTRELPPKHLKACNFATLVQSIVVKSLETFNKVTQSMFQTYTGIPKVIDSGRGRWNRHHGASEQMLRP
jgi:hypothetical protein